MALKHSRGTRDGHEDDNTPPISTASPFAKANPQEERANNPQMATFVQEFMAKMRRRASSTISMPPPSPMVSTLTTFAPISSTPIVSS